MPTINMSYFINMQTLEAIHQAVGVPITHNKMNGNHVGGTNDNIGSDDDEVTEELFESEPGSLSSFGFR